MGAPSIIELTRKLPPLRQARELVNHFASTLQPTVGVLHVPSTRDLVEKIYQSLLEGEDPSWADLMLLFSIFAGAALAWTPGLLEILNATREEAMAAFKAYTHYAYAILDHPTYPLQPSTTALVAMSIMAHLVMNTDGIPMKVPMLRQRCLLMSRELQIHRLDTAKSREERRLNGCDEIDVEVQRRIWWNMVASDWLLSFSGGSQEGAYIFQPKHMNVNLPSNTDDEFITTAGVQQEFPLSIPTSMSAFIFRVKGSELCREVIDALPSILLDSQAPDYDTILDLDAKFQDAFSRLPEFLKLDPVSIERTREICKERPYIAWQRLGIHFSLHTRLCRLHRHYHLEGITNRKYAYSHMVCIHSAHKVLEIRRSMDEVSADVGLMPGRFWTVMHHVFFAALILAMNVSFDPHAPNAAEQKAKVLAAYHTLEKSKQESGYMMQGIQKNLQTLMSTLHKQRTQTAVASQRDASVAQNSAAITSSDSGSIPLPVQGFGDSLTSHGNQNADILQPSSPIAADGMSGGNLINDIGEEGWERVWSEFVAVAPELDVPQWNALLEDVDFNPPLDLY
ncbi:uncharacterized protein N7459_005500 [Penicillium hispanicum]|uniref:uncharacterized protein n=1 Tax=Penicillium hispanicum TaxID=1080232 RepID=UPI00254108A7|nr:uncharacterized protein N7459_005500 [Penicillium hispanicum]KAJ5579515.1 hypothetical protein N7459_005500 [Penicillium hispanicum]